MKTEIPKTYEPGKYEDEIYKLWEKSGFFNPDNLELPKNAKPYTIILPPPNITDKLHMGHASMLAIEDLLIRFHRMKGFRTLWLPGSDHAAIATQNAVEKKLLTERNITRHDLGREKFLEEVWKFLRETQKTIFLQFKKMGSSLDWSREAFTLDEPRKEAVKKMFMDMYQEGLVYQGKRIVNWCPRCHSTLADDELEYKEEKGKLYWLKYGPFILATSRPETKLGDTAVAVYPGDKRYAKMVGKKYKIPGVLGEFEIVVVADKAVDPKFGSGAIKVTPAHSFADNEIARRHNLPLKQIINEEGKMMENCGKYCGMTTKEAREAIVKDMERMGLIDHIEENYAHNLSVCYRCRTVNEPIISKQWFVAVDKKIKRLGNKSLKEKAIEVAKNGKIKFIPVRFTKRYIDWMENLHDWCISRQIWFGHSMPVWKKGEEIYVGENPPEGKEWKQEKDTLDTWFSSGMWTFSTLGWPHNFKNDKKTADLATFHPTQVLETGYDILTLWVSRMIMMTLFAVGEIPFENVYLHGLVLDKLGKKMSKSKGNGIDPLDMVKKYGADAVRLSLLVGSTPGNDVKMYEEKIEGFRNFVTKLWNIYRYTVNSTDDFKLVEIIGRNNVKTLSDEWIVSRLNEVILEISENIDNYKFSLAGEVLQNFIWNDFADWYVEISKMEKNVKILGYVLDKILKLSHPFAPFVSEKIYQDLDNKSILMIQKWPEADKKLINTKSEREFGELQEIITKIRNIRASYSIDPGKSIEAYGTKIENAEIIEKLAKISCSCRTATTATTATSENGIAIAGKNIKITLNVASLIDIEKEKIKLKKEIKNLENLISKNVSLLANKDFLKSAPKDIIEQNKNKLKEYQEKLKNQKELLKNLG